MSDRREIHWQKLRNPKGIAAVLIGTAGGAGLSPFAPGTMGSLVGVPIAYFSSDWAWGWRILLWSALTFAGTWAGKVFQETMNVGDHQSIVMDEVVGLGITAWTAGKSFPVLAAAFVIFRIFDVIKPPPIRQVDRWSKNKSSPWWGGFGVMADDILAGFEGLLVIYLLQAAGIFK